MCQSQNEKLIEEHDVDMNCNYSIEEKTDKYILLRDLSNEQGGKSITNGAEEVIEELGDYGLLVRVNENLNREELRRVFYIDTDGQIDELEFCIDYYSSITGPVYRFTKFKAGHAGVEL